MLEPTACTAARCHDDTTYCSRCDLLVGLEGLHVLTVDRDDGTGGRRVLVESGPTVMGCPACGAIANSHGRREVRLVDAPCFDRPVQVRWRKRTWRCEEPLCPKGVFTEQDENIAAPRALLTTRACWWAINQIRREHGSIAGAARQLGTTWNTVWTAIEPLLTAMADDEARYAVALEAWPEEDNWQCLKSYAATALNKGDFAVARQMIRRVYELRGESL